MESEATEISINHTHNKSKMKSTHAAMLFCIILRSACSIFSTKQKWSLKCCSKLCGNKKLKHKISKYLRIWSTEVNSRNATQLMNYPHKDQQEHFKIRIFFLVLFEQDLSSFRSFSDPIESCCSFSCVVSDIISLCLFLLRLNSLFSSADSLLFWELSAREISFQSYWRGLKITAFEDLTTMSRNSITSSAASIY